MATFEGAARWGLAAFRLVGLGEESSGGGGVVSLVEEHWGTGVTQLK